MKLPCEIIIWYVLPAVRKEIVRNLINDHNYTQAKAAKKLGMTEAAISQYLSGKRGEMNIKDEDILEMIKQSADRIDKGDDSSVIIEMCHICESIKNSDILARIYLEQVGKPLPESYICSVFSGESDRSKDIL